MQNQVPDQGAPSCLEHSQFVSLKHHQAAVLRLDDVDPGAVSDVEDAIEHGAVCVAGYRVPLPQHLRDQQRSDDLQDSTDNA